MEKKISSIGNGPLQFYIVLSLAVICALVGCILLIENSLEEGIVAILLSLLICSMLIIIKFNHFLDYIIVTEKGIKRKKQFYSWDEVFITAGFSIPREHIRKTYVYQLYFGTEYLTDKIEIGECKKKGLFIDINKKRLNLILQYYKKSISIKEELPVHIELLQMMKEHNQTINC